MIMTNPNLKLKDLVCRYPKFTLGPVNLEVPPGVITGLVGPNGAGKSTLMEAIFGVVGKTEGEILVGGFDHLRDELEAKRLMGYAGPDLRFVSWGKIERVMRFVRGLHEAEWDEALERRLLTEWELKPSMKIGALSFGQKTKLALLLALAWRPRLLVLDEPTTGLDPQSRQVLFRELLAMVADGERSVLISSHELAGLERFADRIAVLKEGQLLVEGETADLVSHFRRVTFRLEGEMAGLRPPWFWLENREGDRLRGMIDLRHGGVEALPAWGGQVESQPVTLEEWFLLLTTEGGERA